MRILIVEDDKYKQEAVHGALSGIYRSADIASCRSVQSAVELVSTQDFGLIVLDMSLPSHDLDGGGALGIPRLSGGVEVLFELQYLEKDPKVVILTQYPEIEIANKMIPLEDVKGFVLENFGISVHQCILFDFDEPDWWENLAEGLKQE